MARSRVYRRKSHHKRKGSKRPRTRRHRSRSRRMRGGVGSMGTCMNNNDGTSNCDQGLECRDWDYSGKPFCDIQANHYSGM